MMNQCIVNVIEKTVFIVFTQIVKTGQIEVCSMNGSINSIVKKEIKNTNSTSFNTKAKRGKYKLDIKIDNQQITKFININ
ncbi:MAG: hypothetical protein JEY97_03840 [Bacteroidales bacterium]|nr:hypothetical protein [Bacteroidales bacterium]